MSSGDRVESSLGLELLLRLVAEEMGVKNCGRCGGALSDSRLALRDHDPQKVVVEVTCRACDEPLLITVEPETRVGTAGVR